MAELTARLGFRSIDSRTAATSPTPTPPPSQPSSATSEKETEFSEKLEKISTAQFPDEYLCPITRAVMFDPVLTTDGHSYERTAIEQWFNKSDISPLTRETLANKHLIPNRALRKLIQDAVEPANKRTNPKPGT